MSSLMFAPTEDDEVKVGAVIQVDGKNHIVTKKTTTAIQVRRYYWFDALYDRWFKKECDTCS